MESNNLLFLQPIHELMAVDALKIMRSIFPNRMISFSQMTLWEAEGIILRSGCVYEKRYKDRTHLQLFDLLPAVVITQLRDHGLKFKDDLKPVPELLRASRLQFSSPALFLSHGAQGFLVSPNPAFKPAAAGLSWTLNLTEAWRVLCSSYLSFAQESQSKAA